MAAMAGNTVVIMRLLASAYSVAEKAGSIVRKVLHSGELGIIEKVSFHLTLLSVDLCHLYNCRSTPALLAHNLSRIHRLNRSSGTSAAALGFHQPARNSEGRKKGPQQNANHST